ncbi:unnamed protein product [Triticum turgidum subsp. durum]|uniref:GDSL esterase/lipase n=1 Tax=Triticum turgidum subsp. durum TaxID=4567 RepID=A0A9R0W354_TRITD|nr:unnamed protein product [Triticum turgidum subsp. durum]
MAASTAVSCLCLLLVAAVTFSVAAAAPAPAPPPPFRTVYAFGDSFTDTGNTHSTFFHRSTNRYSDGRLVVDFLATDALALPSFLPPYLSLAAPNASSKSSKYYGANFAVAGATAIEHDFFAKNNLSIDITPQSIMTELGWFDAHLKTRQAKKEEIGEALYWVGEIGANDYAYSFMAADSIPPERIRTMAVDRVTTFLEGLLKRGARYVVVQGLPLTGCLPLAMTLARPEDRDNLSCVASVNKQSMDHNHHLQAGIHRLRQAHPGAVLAYADYYAAHLAVMRSPARYGFAEPFKTCCGSGGGAYNFEIFSTCGSPEVPAACAHPARYVNWDGVHMTEAMYKVVAGMFFRDASGTFIRPSFGSLLAAARKGHGN